MKFKTQHIGIALIIAGIIFFIFFTQKKSGSLVYSKKRTKNKEIFNDNIALKPGNNYIISFSAETEEGGGFSEWPRAAATIKISNQGKKELFKTKIDVTEHQETGGLRRAIGYEEFKHTPTNKEQLSIETQLIEGDKMELNIYENLSELGNILPGLGIILALIGVFVYLRLRKKGQNQKQ